MGDLIKETPYSEITATLETLDMYGVSREHLAQLRRDHECAKRIARFIRQGDLAKRSIHMNFAQAIMPSENFFGTGEWKFLYDVNFTDKQLRKVAEFPWSEDVLNAPCPFHKGKSIKETHFAFLGLDHILGKPLTILKWQKIHPKLGQPQFFSYASDNWHAKDWYAEKFGNKLTCGFRWYLMPLEIVPNSAEKTYQEQVKMLPDDYKVPSAIEEVTKDILYFRKNGIYLDFDSTRAYLNSAMEGRCQDVVLSSERISVGDFDKDGLVIYRHQDEFCDCSIGIAASRKLP